MTIPDPPADRAVRGTPGYRRITRALFVAGLTTFAAMYGTQALLPELSDDFGVSPAVSAMSVSLTTGMIAVAIIPLAVISERVGRTRVIVWSSIVFTLIGLLLPISPDLTTLLIGRAVQGVALAGVPAVAMAYLADEIDPRALGEAMGRYVAGTTLGGLLGRILPAIVLDFSGWRWALAALAVVTALLTGYLVVRLPSSAHFVAHPMSVRLAMTNLAGHLRDWRLTCLFGSAFVLMGGFVSAYNYLGYRLLAEPFDLSEAVVGAVFLLYLAGTFSAAAAGRWADRWGRAPVMAASIGVAVVGLAVTATDSLVAVIVGMGLFTAGFFGAHSVASGWVGVIATDHRAEAASMYLFAYYLGSSVLGALGGTVYLAAGWTGLVAYVAAGLLVAALLVTGLAVAGRRREVGGP
ncbi:MFS transporter [Gordonia soli]|uniref:Putative drug resistance transporter n=1 Tax=Gordonia soli NBRC 108243 TaxID=1223545 RepID=M0QH31_9ACTN|nr:MFS transporter [Gordonia soli]GAC67925.1 putative drug resistance transporter [Gordonia soli NBRC 108243]